MPFRDARVIIRNPDIYALTRSLTPGWVGGIKLKYYVLEVCVRV